MLYRRSLIEQGNESADNARALREACASDILFWVNAFVFTYDPRKDPSTIPFITWPFQDEVILEIKQTIDDAIGAANNLDDFRNHDLLEEKSRDMGLSWINLVVIDWYWHYSLGFSALLGSRKEDLVDKSDDPRSLFWKLDFIHKNLPAWMMPMSWDRTRLHLVNYDMGSTIDGESTNGDFGRGDRRTVILLDEFASVENGQDILSATADATNCRIFNSTPKGTHTAFYKIRERSGVKVLRLHWSRHPEKAKGLYQSKDGRPQILGEDGFPPHDYPFICDGKLRSPWYDAECKRRGDNKVEIAQELDIDYEGSSYQFFPEELISRLLDGCATEPNQTGELDFDLDTLEPAGFMVVAGGPLLLWINLDPITGKPPPGRYIIGGDVSMGSGTSNSALTITDWQTGKKVAEWASGRFDPSEFADQAVALCKWFHNAYLIWEANGPGGAFGKQVIRQGYRNIFFRQKETSLGAKISDVPGWFSSTELKKTLLAEYRRALANGEFLNPSREALRECRRYIVTPSGAIEHSASLDDSDPTGVKDNHGDRVIADAVTYRAMCEFSRPKLSSVTAVIHPRSFAARREAYREKERLTATAGWRP